MWERLHIQLHTLPSYYSKGSASQPGVKGGNIEAADQPAKAPIECLRLSAARTYLGIPAFAYTHIKRVQVDSGQPLS